MQRTSTLHTLIVLILIINASPSYGILNHATNAQIEAYEEYLAKNYKRHIDELGDLIAIPTLSMVVENAEDVKKGAQFLKTKLDSIGMKNARVVLSDGLPFVTAEWMEAEGQPTALFYGHFDVQPAAREGWDSDPFKAKLRGGKLYGRGATDDKGFIMSLLSSIEALMAIDGRLPVNVKFIFDGAEESGSWNMQAFLTLDSTIVLLMVANHGKFSTKSLMV